MRKIIFIILILFAVLFLAGVDYAYFLYRAPEPGRIACTMEAKLCPDGSAVGRTGPNCEFADCPAISLSGIKGVVLLGPMCPVERIPPDPQCADRPYKTVLVATQGVTSQIVKQFNSDVNGNFSVDLPPGEYTIGSADTASYFSHCSSQDAIKVENNKFTNTIINCDTGIR
jgi:hypothetical protein